MELAEQPHNAYAHKREQVIKELVEVSKGKTLIAVTHDDRLAKYFDEVIDMNEMTSGMQDVSSEKEEC